MKAYSWRVDQTDTASRKARAKGKGNVSKPVGPAIPNVVSGAGLEEDPFLIEMDDNHPVWSGKDLQMDLKDFVRLQNYVAYMLIMRARIKLLTAGISWSEECNSWFHSLIHEGIGGEINLQI